MKIIIVKNNYKKKVVLDKGLKHLIDNTPIDYHIEEREANFPMQSRKVGNGTFSGVVADNYYDELRKVVKEGECHVVVLYYNQKMRGVRLSIAENTPLYPNTDVIQVVKEDDGVTFNHELFHVFFKRLARQGIQLHDPMDICFVGGETKAYYNDKNINAKESNRTIALQSLKPYWDKIENIPKQQGFFDKIITSITQSPVKYRYFTEKEVVGLKPELVKKLDDARHIAGIPFKINSGLRTVEQNKKAGGVSDSAHLSGLAVDIACTSDTQRMTIVSALQKVGFNRIGIAKTFVHGDIDTTKTQNVIWLY